jgi:glutamine synthetase
MDALRCLEANSLISQILGEKIEASYLKLKYQEWQNFCDRITAWETENTLDC